MTRLIIVRHAQSESNYAHFFAGSLNVNLSENGRMQAEETAKYLKDTHIDVAYCSNLVRVIQTAKPIVRGRDITLNITDSLSEIRGGGFEGFAYEEIRERYPYERHMWENDILNCYCPSGDSLYDVYNRAIPVFEKIVNENRGKTVLVATHACVIRVVMNRFLGRSFSEVASTPWASNASVSIVDFDDENNYKTVVYSYDEHLKYAGLIAT